MRDRRLVSMEPIPVDTYNIRLVYLILTTFEEKGILNAHFTEEEARLQEDLIFWVPLGAPSDCLFVALWHTQPDFPAP